MVFTTNSPYTLVFSHPLTGETYITEVEIVGMNTKLGRCLFMDYSNGHVGTIPACLDDILVFAGYHLPLSARAWDDQYSEFGCFEFLTDQPQALKTFILQNCLNLSDRKKGRIRCAVISDTHGSHGVGMALFDDYLKHV